MNEEVQYEDIDIQQYAKEKASKFQEIADLIKKGEYRTDLIKEGKYSQVFKEIEDEREDVHRWIQCHADKQRDCIDKEENEAHGCITKAHGQLEEAYHCFEEAEEARLCKEGDIHALYRSLKQKVFTGCYKDIWNEHGKEWDMIDVDNGSTEIIQILKTIHPIANGRVWKGFTGLEDSSYYTNYRFFAEKANKYLQRAQYKVTDVQEFGFQENRKYSEGKGFQITISEV